MCFFYVSVCRWRRKVLFGHLLLFRDPKGLANLILTFWWENVTVEYWSHVRRWTNNIEVFFSSVLWSCNPTGEIKPSFNFQFFFFLVGFGQQSASDNSCRMDNVVACKSSVIWWCKPVACLKIVYWPWKLSFFWGTGSNILSFLVSICVVSDRCYAAALLKYSCVSTFICFFFFCVMCIGACIAPFFHVGHCRSSDPSCPSGGIIVMMARTNEVLCLLVRCESHFVFDPHNHSD